MKVLILVLSLFCAFVSAENVSIDSSYLGEQVDINLSLPSNYEITKASYPVVIVLDGEAYFNVVKEYVIALHKAYRIPELIVVGVPNKNRRDDFIGQNKENFRQFVELELKTLLQKNYRTNNYTVLLGHSLGATFALNSTFSKVPAFNAIAAFSPVISEKTFKNEHQLPNLSNQFVASKKMIFLSKANEQGSYQEKIPPLAQAIQGKNFKYMAFPEETHSSSAILAPYYALTFFFKGWIMPAAENLVTLNSIEKLNKLGGYEKINAYYQDYSKTRGYQQPIPDILLSRIAWIYVREGNTETLLSLMKKEAKNRSELLGYLVSYFQKKDTNIADQLEQLDKSVNG